MCEDKIVGVGGEAQVGAGYFRATSTIGGGLVEVGARHDGFCDPLVTDTART